MTDTNEQAKHVLARMQELIPDAQCPLCHTSKWTINPGTVYVTLETTTQYSASTSAKSLPSVALICLNCGNTHLINVNVLLRK